MLIFRYTFEFSRYGLAAAASFILVAVGIVVTTLYFVVLMRRRRAVRLDAPATQATPAIPGAAS
jgi:ABC-type sugar transport system permease subunit